MNNDIKYDINDLLYYDNLDKIINKIKNKYNVKELKFNIYTTEKQEEIDEMTLDNIYVDIIDIYNWIKEVAYYNNDYDLTVKLIF